MPISIIEIHPQKAKIVEEILAGRPVREIGRMVVPPVSFQAVQRYKASVVKPILDRAEYNERLLNGRKPLSDDTAVRQATQQAILDAPALHIRENRIKIQQALTGRLMTVINERAADMSVCEGCRRPESAHPWEEEGPTGMDGKPTRIGCDIYRRVPGGETGLVIRKLKANGYEYAVDTAVLAEIREQEKHVAVELGQWQENSAAGSVSIQIVCPSASAPAGELPRVSFASVDQIEAGDDSVAEIGLKQLG